VTDEELLERITLNPAVLVGKPVIKGTRLSVELILNLLAHGHDVEEILEEYPGITEDDVRACVLFAHHALSDISFMPLSVGT
jgi:uncharacterized protein (DUF433 family)